MTAPSIREALVKCRAHIHAISVTDNAPEYKQLVAEIDAALSAPPQNVVEGIARIIEPEVVTMACLRSLVIEGSSPNMTTDACERQAGRIVAAILSRFDVRRR